MLSNFVTKINPNLQKFLVGKDHHIGMYRVNNDIYSVNFSLENSTYALDWESEEVPETAHKINNYATEIRIALDANIKAWEDMYRCILSFIDLHNDNALNIFKDKLAKTAGILPECILPVPTWHSVSNTAGVCYRIQGTLDDKQISKIHTNFDCLYCSEVPSAVVDNPNTLVTLRGIDYRYY